MTTALKIRLLLFALTVSFITTALTINVTFDKQRILEFDAKRLEANIHKKETLIKNLLNSPEDFEHLLSVETDESLAAEIISYYRDNNKIYIYTYKNNKLRFWGGDKLSLESDAGLKEGINLIKWDNGWYEGYKRSSGNSSIVCLFPIKWDYPFQNQYLTNTFAADLINNPNIEIASFDDHQVYNIRNSEGKYLFAVKLKSSVTHTFYSQLELWMWILATIFGCIFVTSLCVCVALRKHTKTAIGIMFLFLLALRVATLHPVWFYEHFNIPIFDSQYYYGDAMFPSIGDFLLNMAAATWFLCFAYSYRYDLRFTEQKPGKTVSYITFALFGVIISLMAVQVHELFYSLVMHSEINFDLTNILSLNGFSWLGIFLLCLSFLNLLFIVEILLVSGLTLSLNNKERLLIFIAGVACIGLYKLISTNFTIFFLLFSLVVFMRGWAVYRNRGSFNLATFIITILVFAIISSIKLSRFQFFKERENRKIIAQKLESGDDPNAVLLFFNLEQEILKDNFIINYFKNAPKPQYKLIENLNKNYFDGYLSRYDFKAFTYGPTGSALNHDSLSLSYFKDLVLLRSVKVSEYFYRLNNSFGFQNYFALLPVQSENRRLGTLVVELKSKTFKESDFPAILNNSYTDRDEGLDNYSFAFYSYGQLLYQHGQYIYNLKNKIFAGKPGEFIFSRHNGFNHLVYQPNPNKLLVVSKPESDLLAQLASASFLFLVLILFAVLVVFIYWVVVNFRDHDFRIHLFNWYYIITKNNILYRTRIQASMVIAIISTLIIIGVITYFSIRDQFRAQQQHTILNHINQITEGFEKKMFENNRLVYDDGTLRAFANANTSDLNLYDVSGKLMFTTQPKIYSNHLLSSRLDALAYIYLDKYQRSEYLNPEQIGSLRYLSVYKPIRNENNKTVAYLSLPYYNSEKQIKDRTGAFLNTLINVYALVLVTVGLFAVFIANQITYPLTLVQRSLGQIKIGSKNEPIFWKTNDEIGSLIKEYNNMIAALEESARKLARSERESAWREMAKQVAHEIKNPLTPLKLGVQLLEKSWREKDPNFEKKFEKFTKSFIDQIESLSHIASEFSDFAKMPDTGFENIEVRQIIEQSVELFSKINELTIRLEVIGDNEFMVYGDRDQLLRVFNNLIKNAIEAIPDYRKGEIDILLKKQNGLLHVEVKDNGNGIPDTLRERIFLPNFTTKSSGTGLGLAFIKQATENMMGSVRFETAPNQGTTFFISIPLVS